MPSTNHDISSRYNLKRRVASLPPISADTFSEKVLQARAVSTAETDKAYFERHCNACDKTYYSQNAFQNHLSSQKHKQNELSHPADETSSVMSSTFSLGEPTAVTRQTVDSDAEDEFSEVIKGLSKPTATQQRPSPVKRPSNPQVARGQIQNGQSEQSAEQDSDAETPEQSPAEAAWTLQSCIFCNYNSPTTPLNAQHMERFHGMFIPEKPFLVDLDGLMEKLQRQVRDFHECLSCGKAKANVFAVQTHMRDKGHCKIPFETEAEQLEIGDHYDFRGTYSDDDDSEEDSDEEEEEEPQGGAKLGARRTIKPVRAGKGDKEADGWETDSSASSLDSADLTAVPAEGHIHQFERLDKHPHHSHDSRQRHQADGWHSHAHKHNHAVFHDDYELHLPSGKSVGHRSLNKYYRQNLTHYPTPEERAARKAIEDSERHHSDDDDVAVNGRRNGHDRRIVPRGAAGLTGVTDEGRREIRKAEKRGRNTETIHTKRTDYKVSEKLNNHKSYYYRFQGGG